MYGIHDPGMSWAVFGAPGCSAALLGKPERDGVECVRLPPSVDSP